MKKYVNLFLSSCACTLVTNANSAAIMQIK